MNNLLLGIGGTTLLLFAVGIGATLAIDCGREPSGACVRNIIFARYETERPGIGEIN